MRSKLRVSINLRDRRVIRLSYRLFSPCFRRTEDRSSLKMRCTSLLSSKSALFTASTLLLFNIYACVDTFPPGHLEPLGARSQKHSLEVLDAFPSPQEFFQNYASQLKPVLFRGGAKLSPAFAKWSDEYFLAHEEAANLQIVAEKRKKENRTYPSQDMSFQEFVQNYEQEDIYMVDSVPPFLM